MPSGPAPQPSRLTGLDALRGVAAVAVCLFHWEHIAFQTPNDAQVFRFGLLGVELFFLISGFVIAMVTARTVSVQGFLRARIVRLYPAYLVSVVLTALYVLRTGKYDVSTVLLNGTMLQSFIGVQNIANPYWTLAFEITFYAAMSLVLWTGMQRRIEWLLLAWLVVATVYRLALPGWMSFDPQRPFVQACYIVVAPQFAPFFSLGILAFRASRRQLGIPGMATMVAALALTLQGRGDFAQISGPVYAGFTLTALCALMIAIRVDASDGVANVLRWVGVISYPLYLLHCTVANLCVYALRDVAPASVAVFLSVPVSVVLAASVHHWIEKPAARLFHHRAGPRIVTAPITT